MKTTISRFALSASKINKEHIRIVMMIIALVMLVLGAGAPEEVGGSGI